MEFATPFGIRRQPTAAPGPSQSAHTNTQRFSQLKPICVELLGSVAGITQINTQNRAQDLLRRLHTKLSADSLFNNAGTATSNEQHTAPLPPLSQALISYVFFPVAQLLRAADQLPEKRLPDRLQHLVYLVLADLCRDWWLSWTCLIRDASSSQTQSQSEKKTQDQIQVWHQLLFLAASALAPPMPEIGGTSRQERSEETLQAALSMVDALLAPRFVCPISAAAQGTGSASNMVADDWDDELCLPSLDDYDEIMEAESKAAADAERSMQPTTGLQRVYPSRKHQTSVTTSKGSRGAIAHILMTCVSIARAPERSESTRNAALRATRTIMATWITGDDQALHLLDDFDTTRRAYDLHPGEILQSEKSSTKNDVREATERAVMFLPGVISGLVGILASNTEGMKAPRSSTVIEAIQTLSLCILLCFADERTPSLSALEATRLQEESRQPKSLEEMFGKLDNFKKNEDAGPTLRSNNSVQTTSLVSAQSGALNDREQEASIVDGDERIQGTVPHIAATFLTIVHHRFNANGRVRAALARMAGLVITKCTRLLAYQADEIRRTTAPADAGTQTTILRLLSDCLLDVAADDTSSASAAEVAIAELITVLNTKGKDVGKKIRANLEEDLLASLKDLRSSLSRVGKDEQVCRLALRTRFALRFLSGDVDSTFAASHSLKSFLASSSTTERWLIGFLGSFELTRVRDKDTLEIHGFQSETTLKVKTVFEAVGAASARTFLAEFSTNSKSTEKVFALHEKVLQLGLRWRSSINARAQRSLGQSLSLNAIFVADCMMTGLASILDDSKLASMTGRNSARVRRRAQRFTRSMVDLVVGVWEEDEQQILDETKDAATSPVKDTDEQALLINGKGRDDELQEYRRGDALTPEIESDPSFQLGPAVRLDFVNSATIHRNGKSSAASVAQFGQAHAANLQDADMMLLSIVAAASRVTGPSLRQTMIKLLYPIISAAASEKSRIQSAATRCLGELAHSAGYASIQGCIHDHADYLLGAASHRLVSTLALELQSYAYGKVQTQEASRSSATQSRPQTQLDVSRSDRATYPPLMSAQSAPLVLVEIVRMLGSEALALIEDAVDEVLDAVDKFHLDAVTCDALLDVLDRLMEVMQSDVLKSGLPPQRKKHGQLTIMPSTDAELDALQAWIKQIHKPREEAEVSASNAQNGNDSQQEAEEKNATRSQEVAIAMLYKALPFVSHSAWTIRLRCLRLLNRGIDMLCLQGRTIEPISVVNSLWPLLMARLGFSSSRTLPSIDGKLPAPESLDEQVFAVYLEAVDLVGTLAHHLADFLGSEKLLRQALPRLLLLLKIVETADEGGRSDENAFKPTSFRLETDGVSPSLLTSTTENDQTKTVSKATKPSRKALRLFRRFSPPALLIEHIIVAVDRLIAAMGASLAEEDLFALATHSTLLSCLDERQIDDIGKHARHLYHVTLRGRNEALVWLVLAAATNSSQDTSHRFPTFMQMPDLRLRAL